MTSSRNHRRKQLGWRAQWAGGEGQGLGASELPEHIRAQLFCCAPLGSRLTRQSCARQYRRATGTRAEQQTATTLEDGHPAPASRDALADPTDAPGVCRGCPVGAAHARGEEPGEDARRKLWDAHELSREQHRIKLTRNPGQLPRHGGQQIAVTDHEDHRLGADGRSKYVRRTAKHCNKCGEPFAPRSNRQYRCDDCSPYVQERRRDERRGQELAEKLSGVDRAMAILQLAGYRPQKLTSERGQVILVEAPEGSEEAAAQADDGDEFGEQETA